MNKEKFFNDYFSDDYDIEKFRKALEYKEENFPKSLFTYERFDKKNHTLDLLNNDLLFLSTVEKFNDPYEGDFIFDIEEIFYFHFLNKVIYDYFEHPNNKISSEQKENILKGDSYKNLMNYIYYNDSTVNNEEFSPSEFIKRTKNFLEDYYSSTIEDFNSFLKSHTLVSCFSEKNIINPMWAHYADNHKGICIEYNFKDLDNSFVLNSCFPISYVEHFDMTNDLKRIDSNSNKFKILKIPFLNKSIDWEYEKEWRILLTNDPFFRFDIKKINSNYYIKIPRPRSVYLGLNIEDDDKEKIIEICKNREITVYQMEKDNSGYNLKPNLLFKAPQGKWDEEEYILDCLKKKSYKNLIYKYFSLGRITVGEIERKQNLILKCLKKLSEEDLIHFLDSILFINGVFPVLNDYYSQILIFLDNLNEDKYFKNIKTSNGLSIPENLEKWISNTLFKFYDLKIIRYFIFFERLFKRFYTYYLVLNENSRKKFAKRIPEFKINDKYLKLIEITEYKKDSNNETYFIHPLCDIDFSEIIDKNILNNLEIILNSYYIDQEFNEDKCYEEYLKFKKIVEDLENYSSKDYEEIYNNSKDKLIINFEAQIYPYFDDYLSMICAVLYNNKLLNLLNDEEKEFLKNLNRIRIDDGKFENPSRISSFLGKCCEELDLNFDEIILKPNELDEYFSPKFVSLDF